MTGPRVPGTALALALAGVPFEVVPGVTSAVAAPALAGIPVTHRGVATSFAVATATTVGGGAADLERLAGAADTLVVLMAAGRLHETCAALERGGRDPEEPAAVVASAGTPDQHAVIATLGELPERATEAGITAPATLVVGAVVALSPLIGSPPRGALRAPRGSPPGRGGTVRPPRPGARRPGVR